MDRNLFRAFPGFKFAPFSTQHTMKGRTSLMPGLALTTKGAGFSETCRTFTISLLASSSSSCSPSPLSFFCCCFSLFFFLVSSLALSAFPFPRPPARRYSRMAFVWQPLTIFSSRLSFSWLPLKLASFSRGQSASAAGSSCSRLLATSRLWKRQR